MAPLDNAMDNNSRSDCHRLAEDSMNMRCWASLWLRGRGFTGMGTWRDRGADAVFGLFILVLSLGTLNTMRHWQPWLHRCLPFVDTDMYFDGIYWVFVVWTLFYKRGQLVVFLNQWIRITAGSNTAPSIATQCSNEAIKSIKVNTHIPIKVEFTCLFTLVAQLDPLDDY